MSLSGGPASSRHNGVRNDKHGEEMLRGENVNSIAVCYTLYSCGKSCAQKDRKTEETIGRCGLGPCGRLCLAGISDFVS